MESIIDLLMSVMRKDDPRSSQPYNDPTDRLRLDSWKESPDGSGATVRGLDGRVGPVGFTHQTRSGGRPDYMDDYESAANFGANPLSPTGVYRTEDDPNRIRGYYNGSNSKADIDIEVSDGLISLLSALGLDKPQ